MQSGRTAVATLLIVVLTLAVSNQARAGQSAALANQRLDSLAPDIQGKVMTEARSVEEQCAGDNTYSIYHDCHCIAGKFIDARIDDPEKGRENLTFALRKECVNAPAIIKYSYEVCVKRFSRFMPKTQGYSDEERSAYCKCFGNTMAASYSNTPDPRHSYISNMQVQVLNSCLSR
jgi:hypothetical protein